MSDRVWIILAIVNVPVYFGLGWCLFHDWEDFLRSIRFWITPNLISLIRGEYWADWWGTMKLGIWVGACVACVVIQVRLLEHILG